MICKITKRLLDVSISLFVLLIISPILILISFLIYFEMGRPVFFIQERPGLKGKIFKIYKFRTMLNLYDQKGNLLPNEKRITKLGKILRNYSLDELPTFLNVLKGEMSLVGPRPLRVEYLPRYSQEQMRRHDVKPGISGLAQVKGRNLICWEEKFKWDIFYVDNWNLWLDFKIILLTILKVIRKEGISPKNGLTMEEFKGRGK